MRSALLKKTLICPGCKEPATQTLLISSLCFSAEKESDGHTTRYGWRKSDIDEVHPPLYSLVTCPHCLFTDLASDFAKPSNTKPWRRALSKHKSNTPADQKLVSFIHRHIHFDRRSHADALAQHLLALFIYESVLEQEQDSRKLARLYLRTAWLYREKSNLAKFLLKFTKAIKQRWKPAPLSEREALALAIPHFIRAIDTDPFYQDNRNFMNTLKLIGELYVRIDQLNEALKFLGQVTRRSHAEKRKFELIYRDKKSTEDARKRARVDLMRVSAFIRDVERIQEELVDKLNARDAHIIEPIVSTLLGEEALAQLKAKGLHRAQITRLQSEGKIKAAKKRFGIF